ncbi:EamA family transporter [Chitinivorax sp. B]|uniref:DMT family transporter n=1 Tax=Chitinivorax sp. B TaxID=2502235 RepID=UPI0010F73DD0|nr:EamA family transporter [Chitinivorax sp. B]
MNNLSLYLTTVLIWGSTWLAIKFQLGSVPVEWSVAYRFGLAALILFLWCAWRRLPMRFSRRDHAFIALQGILLFGGNYVLIYHTERFLSSGTTAVLFSTVVLMNTLGMRIFFKQAIERKVIASAALGIMGISLVFWQELTQFDDLIAGLIGIGLGLLATFCASLGNMASSRNVRAGIPVVQSNAFGMAYGTLAVVLVAILLDRPLILLWQVNYVVSLIYLAVFGSILAFGAYLTLIGKIGADRASYAGVVIPVVALLLSTWFEQFTWHTSTVIGIALCLAGNVLMLQKSIAAPVLRPVRSV